MGYQVLYYGQLKPGVSLSETIAKLASISGFSAEKTQQHFFAGQPVKLKQFSDNASAQTFITKLFDHGIIAEINGCENTE